MTKKELLQKGRFYRGFNNAVEQLTSQYNRKLRIIEKLTNQDCKGELTMKNRIRISILLFAIVISLLHQEWDCLLWDWYCRIGFFTHWIYGNMSKQQIPVFEKCVDCGVCTTPVQWAICQLKIKWRYITPMHHVLSLHQSLSASGDYAVRRYLA